MPKFLSSGRPTEGLPKKQPCLLHLLPSLEEERQEASEVMGEMKKIDDGE